MLKTIYHVYAKARLRHPPITASYLLTAFPTEFFINELYFSSFFLLRITKSKKKRKKIFDAWIVLCFIFIVGCVRLCVCLIKKWEIGKRRGFDILGLNNSAFWFGVDTLTRWVDCAIVCVCVVGCTDWWSLGWRWEVCPTGRRRIVLLFYIHQQTSAAPVHHHHEQYSRSLSSVKTYRPLILWHYSKLYIPPLSIVVFKLCISFLRFSL